MELLLFQAVVFPTVTQNLCISDALSAPEPGEVTMGQLYRHLHQYPQSHCWPTFKACMGILECELTEKARDKLTC